MRIRAEINPPARNRWGSVTELTQLAAPEDLKLVAGANADHLARFRNAVQSIIHTYRRAVEFRADALLPCDFPACGVTAGQRAGVTENKEQSVLIDWRRNIRNRLREAVRHAGIRPIRPDGDKFMPARSFP